MTWNAPEIEVTIGERTRIGTVRKMEIAAARSQPVATATLGLSNLRFEWKDGAADGDPLIVKWGWRGKELTPLFDGTVLRGHLRESLQVWGLCRGRALSDTRITRTYQDEEARAIIEHLVGDCSFTAQDIVSCDAILDKLPLHDSTVVEAIQFLNRRLELEHDFWCDPIGGFYWGPRDLEQEPVASFTHGEEVIAFKQLPGNRFLLTVMGAPLWHSQIVSVFDRDGSEIRYFIEQVRHSVGVSGEGARSRLWLTEVDHA